MRDLGTVMVMALLVTGGCASKPDTKPDETPTAEAAQGGVEGGGDATAAQGVTPEKMEEIDMFFHQKAKHLQFECYNAEVDRTRRKYEGNVSVSLVVVPGGKASEVKLINSTLHSMDADKVPAEGVVECVLENVRTWNWPTVPAPVPYMGSIGFKPAW